MSGAGIADREIVLTRLFEAPRELVFQAWTDPDLLMRWLCPKDFVVTFVDIDLREGGSWRSGMRSPDGIDYIMRGTYRVVKEPEMLVLTHSWEDDLEPGHLPGHETLLTVIFSDVGPKTQMTFHVTGLTSDDSRDGQKQGWSEAFDNLASAIERKD
jgi:uncharacterized protein YndB with AHSA1/START domain